MTMRVLFLGEGTSDSGIVPQIEKFAAQLSIEIAVTDPDLSRLSNPPGRAVADKLRVAVEIGGRYDLIIVHRDADRDGRQARLAEITQAIQTIAPTTCHAAVIPVRMTEAWLLTNESEIRQIAGNPKGRIPLNLPAPTKVESLPDPKKTLKETLGVASGLSGRKLNKFHDRFSQHRRQLLERLDPDGGIKMVPSWQFFITDLKAGLTAAADKVLE
ncbi:hypothetical protein ACFFQW_43710 [Umezawaea endophytica]|uniref:DUF4276 family protein n=1 Tax=Umezawaea endophytica TaxID=1654476 RepID=A0A9X2VQW7_9PSEU|nr:hypothetical protein [Umezawaea endophytica]MCS7480964.1 hypothetical protein [Umezawaea endophytica]